MLSVTVGGTPFWGQDSRGAGEVSGVENRRRCVHALAAILFVVGFWPAAAAARADLRTVFEKILQAPNDTALNLRYARLAEAQGAPRKALGAYERILANDPTNRAAQQGLRRIRRLLEPSYTEIVLGLGGRYETNPRLRQGGAAARDDGTLSGDLSILDERTLGGRRWRSEGALLANRHIDIHQLDYGQIGGNIGPLFDLSGGWALRPALGATFAWLHGKPFLGEGALLVGVEGPDAGAFRRLDLRIAVDKIDRRFSSRDGVIVSLSPRFVFPSVLTPGDAAVLRPRYRYNGGIGRGPVYAVLQGDIFPFRYHELGVHAAYSVPLMPGVRAGIGLTLSYRLYDSDIPGTRKGRRDVLVAPSVRLVLTGLFSHRHDLVLSYGLQRNTSNDGHESFTNQVVSIRSVWRIQ